MTAGRAGHHRWARDPFVEESARWSVRSHGRPCRSSPAAFVAGCILQVFLAGLGVFDNPASFVTHRDWGYTLELFVLAMLILALLGREPRRIVGLCVLLIVQFVLQSVFVALRVDYPTIAALHPVNGFLILAVGSIVARLSWQSRREAAPASAPSSPAPSASGASAEAR